LVAGIIAGAVVGDLIEANGNTYEGTEYVIESVTGLLLTVAQVNRDEEVSSKEDRVILVYGYPHRLIRDPR
jgi:outer membrane lipoprotein SlyB